jgi:hypothetical protein
MMIMSLVPNFKTVANTLCCITVDCERSLLSAGLDFQACERKGGTADNTSINEIRVAHTTQNSMARHRCQKCYSILR